MPQNNPRWRTAAILKNGKILIPLQPIDRFRRNLARWCVSKLWTIITDKILRFQKSKMHQLAKFCQNRSIGCKDIKIFWLFKIAAATILYFQNREFLFPVNIGRVQTRHCTKLRQNCSFHCGDNAIFRIFKMAAAAILDFWNCEILLVIVVQSMETHQYAKFRQNQSIGCEGIKIIRFFKMAAVDILDFRNREFLFADGLWRAQSHHCTKYCQNQSLLCGDIAIIRIFKMPASAILDFWNREILLAIWVQKVEMHQHAKFCQNRSIGCEDIKIFRFSRCRPSAILDLFGAYLDHPQWVLRGLYHSAKFGYDRWSSFYNMNTSIFGGFGWKMPIYTSKIGVFGQFDPLNGLQYQPKPKTHLTWVCVIWAIKHENVVNGLTCRWVA